MKTAQFLEWITKLQALAQNGLTFCQNPFDQQRYQQIRNIAAEMAAICSNEPIEKIEAFFAHEQGYATPKLDVRGLVIHQNQLLFVKEKSDGLWTLPGGYVDVMESPSTAVEREILEESGYKTKVIRLLALYDKFKHDYPLQFPHTYKLFFLCELIEKQGDPDYEIDDVGFFDEHNLPNLSLPRITASQIHKLLILTRENCQFSDFD